MAREKMFPASHSPWPPPYHCSLCCHDLKVLQENIDLFSSLSGDVNHLTYLQQFSCMPLEHHPLLGTKQLSDPISFSQCPPRAQFCFLVWNYCLQNIKTSVNKLEIVISTDAIARLGFSWWRRLRGKHFVLGIVLGVFTTQGEGWHNQKQALQQKFFPTHVLTY